MKEVVTWYRQHAMWYRKELSFSGVSFLCHLEILSEILSDNMIGVKEQNVSAKSETYLRRYGWKIIVLVAITQKGTNFCTCKQFFNTNYFHGSQGKTSSNRLTCTQKRKVLENGTLLPSKYHMVASFKVLWASDSWQQNHELGPIPTHFTFEYHFLFTI